MEKKPRPKRIWGSGFEQHNIFKGTAYKKNMSTTTDLISAHTELNDLIQRLLKSEFELSPTKRTARVISLLSNLNAQADMARLRDACIIGKARQYPSDSLMDLRGITGYCSSYLEQAAELADMYNANRETLLLPRLSGPVAQFYLNSIGTRTRY